MSILNKQNTPDKWKNKYFDLLDENEALENTYLDKESLLCKTIVRLSLASTGFSKHLDPHLLRIRQQLKNGLKDAKLKVELERFSTALMTLEEMDSEESKPDASLLFNFLFEHFSEQKTELQHIEAKYEKDGYSNTQYLFVDINDLIDSIQQIEPLTEQDSTTLVINEDDSKLINAQIQHLLEDAEIPELFEAKAKALKDKLYTNIPIVNILEDTASLLFQIKKHLQSEQQEMAMFLAQLTEQLTELGIKASGAHSASKTSAEKRTLLDQSVSSQMFELQTSSKNATHLEPLKQLIHSRLADITRQIQNQQVQEEVERNQIHSELETLTTKIVEMEQESRELHTKLDSAHQKATHDPLTNLPNRLAYDERLETELARWKRYKNPLSILVWDIDLFKQINDNFGHKAGDKTLILIAKLLQHHCRETDFVSRFGGEEFTMLLTDTDSQSALKTAEKIRLVIENSAFNSNGKKLSITISCGITQFTTDDTSESAFNRADKALYKAKNNGRNQCIIG